MGLVQLEEIGGLKGYIVGSTDSKAAVVQPIPSRSIGHFFYVYSSVFFFTLYCLIHFVPLSGDEAPNLRCE